MPGFNFGQRFTLPGTSVISNLGTATLIATPGAGKFWRLGALQITPNAAFTGIIQDSDGTEIFTIRATGAATIPLTIPASGFRAPTANKALQLVNTSGVNGTVGVLGFYRTESF